MMLFFILNVCFLACLQPPEEIDRANSLLSSGNEVDAIALYEQIIIENPGSPDALEAETNLKDLFQRYADGLATTQPQQAIKLYRGIKARWPKSSQAAKAKMQLKKMQAEGLVATGSFPTTPVAVEALPAKQTQSNQVKASEETKDPSPDKSNPIQSDPPPQQPDCSGIQSPEDAQVYLNESPNGPCAAMAASRIKPSLNVQNELDDLTVKCTDSRAVCKRLENRFKTLISKKKEQEYLTSVFYVYSKNTLRTQSLAIAQGEAFLKKLSGRGDNVSALQMRLKERCGGCEKTKANFDELHACRSILQNPSFEAIEAYKKTYPNGACYDFPKAADEE